MQRGSIRHLLRSDDVIEEGTAYEDVSVYEEVYDEGTAYEDETIYEDETVYEDESVYDEMTKSGRRLVPLQEEDYYYQEQETVATEEDATTYAGESVDFEDQSTVWEDDGRGIVTDPNQFPGTRGPDHFSTDYDDDDDDDDPENSFVLNVPDIEDVSSLEDLSGEDEESIEDIVATLKDQSKEPLSPNRNHLSADWDAEDLMGLSPGTSTSISVEETEPVSPRKKKLAAMSEHSRSFRVAIKRKRNQNPVFCGRTSALGQLKEALKAVEVGSSKPQTSSRTNSPDFRRLVWIYGNAGIGKTALVEAFLRDNVLHSPGWFVAYGNCDEKSQWTKPYAALSNAYMDIVDNLIQDTAMEGTDWKERITEGLGNDVKLLTRVVPNLSILLETDDDEEEDKAFDMPATRLFTRLRFAMRRFLRIVCRHCKVLIFLDDLHWGDEDSLRMIEAILSTYGLRNFLFVGGHRGVKRTHALTSIKSKLTSLAAADIMVGPVNDELATDIIQGCLREIESTTKQQDLGRLCKWIADKAGGYPFNLQQTVFFLVEKRLLRYEGRVWKWNADLYSKSAQVTAGPVELIAERIRLLPSTTRLILKSAGFLGMRSFRLDALLTATNVVAASEKTGSISSNPIADTSMLERELERIVDAQLMEIVSPGQYAFVHDITRKGAITFLHKSKIILSNMHFDYAQELIEMNKTMEASMNFMVDPDVKEQIELLVAYQFSLASENLKDHEDRRNLCTRILQISEASMQRGAFSRASKKLQSALSLLNESKMWKDDYSLALNLHLAIARARLCQNNTKECRTFASTILSNGRSPRDKLGAYELLVLVAIVVDELDEALHVTKLALKDVWDESFSAPVEEEVERVRKLVHSKSDSDILALPAISHKKVAKKLSFLSRMAEISRLSQDTLHHDFAALRMTELTLRYGSSNESSLGFCLFGVCLARREFYAEAYRCGHLAEMMADEATPTGAQALAFHHSELSFWRKPMHLSAAPLQNSAMVAIATNDMENLSFHVGAYLSNIIVSGSHLRNADKLFGSFKDYSIAFEPRQTWLVTAPYKFILRMRGESVEVVERGLGKQSDARAIQHGIFFHVLHAVFTHDFEAAERLQSKLLLKPEGVWVPYRGFLEGLTATSMALRTKGKVRARYQRKAAKIIEVLSGWARKGMKQILHMAHMVNVDLRMSLNMNIHSQDASALYDGAIAAAAKAKFVHHEALANERAALTFMSRDEDALASKYLTRANQLYEIWGAKSKVHLFRLKFAKYLLSPSQIESGEGEIDDPFSLPDSGPSPTLDFGASQMIHFDPSPHSPRAGRGRGFVKRASRRGERGPRSQQALRGRGFGPRDGNQRAAGRGAQGRGRHIAGRNHDASALRNRDASTGDSMMTEMPSVPSRTMDRAPGIDDSNDDKISADARVRPNAKVRERMTTAKSPVRKTSIESVSDGSKTKKKKRTPKKKSSRELTENEMNSDGDSQDPPAASRSDHLRKTANIDINASLSRSDHDVVLSPKKAASKKKKKKKKTSVGSHERDKDSTNRFHHSASASLEIPSRPKLRAVKSLDVDKERKKTKKKKAQSKSLTDDERDVSVEDVKHPSSWSSERRRSKSSDSIRSHGTDETPGSSKKVRRKKPTSKKSVSSDKSNNGDEQVVGTRRSGIRSSKSITMGQKEEVDDGISGVELERRPRSLSGLEAQSEHIPTSPSEFRKPLRRKLSQPSRPTQTLMKKAGRPLKPMIPDSPSSSSDESSSLFSEKSETNDEESLLKKRSMSIADPGRRDRRSGITRSSSWGGIPWRKAEGRPSDTKKGKKDALLSSVEDEGSGEIKKKKKQGLFQKLKKKMKDKK